MMIWGSVAGVRQGLAAQGPWWRRRGWGPGAELPEAPHPSPPHPGGDTAPHGCVPTRSWGSSGYRDELDGDGHGQLGSKLVVELLHDEDGHHGNDGCHQGAHVGLWQLLADLNEGLEDTGRGNRLRKADASLAGLWGTLCGPQVSASRVLGNRESPLTLNNEIGPECSPTETPKTFLSWEMRTCTEAAVV